MSMSQIRTYSKTKPKTIILNETSDSIFDQEKENNGKLSDTDTYLMPVEERKLKAKENFLTNNVIGRKMRPVTDRRSKPTKKLKSTKKSKNQQTRASLKRKQPLEMLRSPIKESLRCQKTKQLKIGQEKDCSLTNHSKKNQIKRNFSWSGSENNQTETSIEILRKDEGMTWQQKISFLLPKMNQKYPTKSIKELELGDRIWQDKAKNTVLNLSAEEIPEIMSESNSEDDYTYTWVTESATNTKTNSQHLNVPNTNMESTNYSSATLVPEDMSKLSSLKKCADQVPSSRTGKLKLPAAKTVNITKLSPCEFIGKDKDGISFTQKWNSTIYKDAQNIKDCGFPGDVSSIRLPNNNISTKKTELQIQEENTPHKNNSDLVSSQECNKAPSRPKKKTVKPLTSTKMFVSDIEAFEDILPEMSTIKKVAGRLEESIEITREKSPFVMQRKTVSPITPFLSPKKDNEQVYTSTPTKDKNNKDKEFPEFDLSSVQIAEFDEDELPMHESREVNSQEIVCEPTEEDIDIPDPVLILDNEQEVELKEKASNKNVHNVIESTNSPQNSRDKSLNKRNKSLDSITNYLFNTSVVPLNKSTEQSKSVYIGKKDRQIGSSKKNVDECCIAAFSIPVKPIKKTNCQSDYKHILKFTPRDCIQQIYQ